MGIGRIYTIVIDVNDLDTAADFWCELTGLEVVGSHGRYRYLGTNEPRKAEIALQLTDREKGPEPNRSHLDIDVEDSLDEAIDRVLATGGHLKKEPNLYPRPGTVEGALPGADWAVMQDPFGNEFCLIAPITKEQAAAAVAAWEDGVTDDRALRVAAGVTPA